MTDDEFLAHATDLVQQQAAGIKLVQENAALRGRIEQLETVVRELSNFDLPVTERTSQPRIIHPKTEADIRSLVDTRYGSCGKLISAPPLRSMVASTARCNRIEDGE